MLDFINTVQLQELCRSKMPVATPWSMQHRCAVGHVACPGRKAGAQERHLRTQGDRKASLGEEYLFCSSATCLGCMQLYFSSPRMHRPRLLEGFFQTLSPMNTTFSARQATPFEGSA